ncbi:MazG-like family protein [Actinomadura atramentaria]|uniref:MazG-like family protein n=1 Tax=Actinomadura atramentaria TaxID=1990 RepID=UPI0003A79530|nr:MazG-like family protein [Actinomadura atramentaria]
MILKIGEEYGEAIEAHFGERGLNPRKGICHSQEDVLNELADVILTAAVAMVGVANGDVSAAKKLFEKRLRYVTERPMSPER